MTKRDPRAALERAAQVASSLHAASDELSKRLLHVEALLLSQKLGTSASVTIVSSQETGETWVVLYFGKHGGKWGLFTVSGRQDLDEEPESQHYTPIVHASREHRLLAADALPKLIEALEAAVRDQLTAITEATNRVDQLIRQLGGSPNKEGGE